MWVFRSAIWPASLLKLWLTLAEYYNETWPSKLLLTYHMLVSVQFLEPDSYDCEKKIKNVAALAQFIIFF